MSLASSRASRAAWKPPSRARVARIRARLAEVYGVPVAPPHGHPIAELVLTVLSQSTNDRNRDVAYLRLRERFPDWHAVRDAPLEEIEEAIRPGRHLEGEVRAHPGDPARDRRPAGPRLDGARAGRRVARLPLRAAGRRAQDRRLRAALHVRPARRPGRHARLRASARACACCAPARRFDEQHDAMLALTPPGAELELHINLLRHGRRTCHAQRPACDALRAGADVPEPRRHILSADSNPHVPAMRRFMKSRSQPRPGSNVGGTDEFRILGSLRRSRHGIVPLGGPKPRALLASPAA